MHGLIFVTWENYLNERFGGPLLATYRKMIGETAATAPLASRVYADTTLLAGVGAASQLTGLAADTLLYEYGRYFILNGLTSHLCAYLLRRVHSGQNLLLMMRKAHFQMSLTPDGLTPPLFEYEAIPGDPHGFMLRYNSPRQLCAVLRGAIEGAAERYGERVRIVERTCMKRGAAECRFEIHFFAPHTRANVHQDTPEQQARHMAQQQLAELVLAVLPRQDGMTLKDVQEILRSRQATAHQLRPSILLEAILHLQHVGLIASTANQPNDNLTCRRYWRVLS
jgi:Predicted hydrocarbon binding protein (contains V4R domain)